MKNNNTKKIVGVRQQEIILRGLPYGIYAEKFMIGNTTSETRTIEDAYHTLTKKSV